MLKLESILVPVDFSAGAKEAMACAVEVAGRFEAAVEVLHVWQPPPYIVPEMIVTVPGGASMAFDEFMQARTQKDVEQFVTPYKTANLEIRCHVEAGTPQDIILDWCTEHPVDLIVMGTHGHRGLMHFLMGSVAEGVVRAAPCPVMTLRHQGAKAEPASA